MRRRVPEAELAGWGPTRHGQSDFHSLRNLRALPTIRRSVFAPRLSLILVRAGAMPDPGVARGLRRARRVCGGRGGRRRLRARAPRLWRRGWSGSPLACRAARDSPFARRTGARPRALRPRERLRWKARRRLGRRDRLDAEIARCKARPCSSRRSAARSPRATASWTNTDGVPYDVTEAFMQTLYDEHDIDYIVHGRPVPLPDGTDALDAPKRAGKFRHRAHQGEHNGHRRPHPPRRARSRRRTPHPIAALAGGSTARPPDASRVHRRRSSRGLAGRRLDGGVSAAPTKPSTLPRGFCCGGRER